MISPGSTMDVLVQTRLLMTKTHFSRLNTVLMEQETDGQTAIATSAELVLFSNRGCEQMQTS